MARLAVVEDNPDNRLLLQAMLGDEYAIAEYVDGPDALEGLRRDPPDLVLLDISLPGMDGLEVLRRLRSDATTADLPVVALTAHAMCGDRERFLSAGFNGYVSKPITDMVELTQEIDRLLVASVRS